MTLDAGGNSLLRGMAQTSDSDTHDDFAPQVKASPASSVVEQIQQDIKEHKVFVYMKVQHAPCSSSKKMYHMIPALIKPILQGNPEAPMCGFSNMVCKILDAYGEGLLLLNLPCGTCTENANRHAKPPLLLCKPLLL